ncbi:MAG: hypothetical protein BMS9Abin29_1297 [Gemmatimonadota bacterium]|nr:MAG: hypothetical protein BMS9Abin29_1297 [Gemmatimonadota bacterium]
MTRPEQGPRPFDEGWTIERAEELLNSLVGVVSARVVARPGGSVEEIHLLATRDLTPKQIVRNVESALLARFDLEVDHRVISVAQAEVETETAKLETEAAKLEVVRKPEASGSERRILFVGHQVLTERAHRVRAAVTVEWRGKHYTGEATGADLPRARLDTTATATLAAIENGVSLFSHEDGATLSLDGVRMVEAFDQTFVLVAVHAMHGRQITALAGAAAVDDSPDRAVILGTLQATDRWIRGRI